MTARDEDCGRGATGVACTSSVRMTTNFLMSPSGELTGSPAVDVEGAALVGAAVDDDTAIGVLLAAVGARAGVGATAGIRVVFVAVAGGPCCCSRASNTQSRPTTLLTSTVRTSCRAI